MILSLTGKSYRTESEVTKMRNTRDCILLVANRLKEKNWATEEELDVSETGDLAVTDKGPDRVENTGHSRAN